MNKYTHYQSKFKSPEKVNKQFMWFGYKEGKVGQFSEREMALKYSSNIEKVCTNEKQVKEYSKLVSDYNKQVFDAWYSDLRDEYSTLWDEQFELCYEEACSRGDNYDEISSILEDVVEFAVRLLKTK